MGKTVAKAVCEVLEHSGVTTVFGIPGIHIEQMYEALAASPNLHHVLTRHEQGAAFAADGYARVSGAPGVCLTTTGPGATNTLTPLVEAYADSIPVVVLAGQIDAELIGLEKGLLHEISDQAAMFTSVTKRIERPRSAEQVPRAVADVLAAPFDGRPRPCYVELPTDLLGLPGSVPDPLPHPATPPAPDETQIARAAELLGRAERPVVVAGGGTLWGTTPQALVALAEQLNAPVLTTVKGNGVIGPDHRLHAGCIHPLYGGAPLLLSDADAVLVVASQLDDETTGRWQLRLPNIVQIDIDQAEIGRNYPVEVGIVADAAAALAAISAELAPSTASSWSPDAARRANEELYASVGPALGPEIRMIRELRQRLPRDTVMVSDQGIVNAWTAWFWPAVEPRTQLFPWGGATLGYGLPAAIGASFAAPSRPVVVIAGDGGFMFNSAELATCVKYGLNITVVVVNNNAYGSIAESQRQTFGRDSEATLCNPDFAQFAAAFGIPFRRVEDLGNLAAQTAAAVAEPGPSLIEVVARIRQPWA
jgi:thiamine pyrophosphate-dependent acetolactate synthase large subunit-like protein